MTLHIEMHTRTVRGRKKEDLLLVTDTGVVIATFKSAAMARLYTEQVSLTWMSAHEAGRLGI